MMVAKSYFFCGIGGSGMLPLAMIARGRGGRVAGSDRSLDQGRLAPKFDFLRRMGIALYPQDGSGLVSKDQILVTSAAIEESVPDVRRATELGLERKTRPQLLAEMFNGSAVGIAVGGTSGKSTVTGMIGWILHQQGRDPTVMNGAVMKNFASADRPFASALVGRGDPFVSEVDESDGSIEYYRPAIAALTNISLDHKSLEELRRLFHGFAAQAGSAILNLDDPETRLIAAALPPEKVVTFGLKSGDGDVHAEAIRETPAGVSFHAVDRRRNLSADVALQVPGRHNVENALAALAVAAELEIALPRAAQALAGFAGLRRRLESVGSAQGVAVIDDFAHNPDKIAATLRTLRAFPGRLLVYFQPHGFGPLRTMLQPLAETFAAGLTADDLLLVSDPAYFGGTTDRSIGSGDLVAAIARAGKRAEHCAEREDCGRRLVGEAREGDRILVMGARDDTLTLFAERLLEEIGSR